MRHGIACVALVAFLISSPGCELLYFAAGKGKTKAQYTLPKGKRVLILVDFADGVVPPPSFAASLADKLGGDLFSNKVVDNLVSQEKILTLQHDNPDAFKKMKVGDVARETGADIVVNLFFVQLATPLTADGSVIEGQATAYVHVYNKQGARLWPSDATGTKETAAVGPTLLGDKNLNAVLNDLSGQVVTQTSRMFRDYSQEGHDFPH
ncbi:MAG TPA: hypothetical protein VGN88_01425 [Phycisphaerae bacterium]|jgi:hypothetical protein